MKEIPGGREKIEQELAALGPMKTDEKKLMFISVVLLFFWATEKIVHPFDTSSTTIVAVTLMMMPGIGIMTWKEVQERINWGTLLLFGVGISLGDVHHRDSCLVPHPHSSRLRECHGPFICNDSNLHFRAAGRR